MDSKEQQIQELLTLLGERDRQILDIKKGFEGCCTACEPVGSLNKDLELQVLAKDKEIAALKEQLVQVRKERDLEEFRKDSYIKDSWKTAAERDEARKMYCFNEAVRLSCLHPDNPDFKAYDETIPVQIAEQLNWSCFDKSMEMAHTRAATRSEALDKRNGIADEILGSEQFMWLMVGSNYVDQHLRDIRPAWTAWIDAGGKSYGKRQ